MKGKVLLICYYFPPLGLGGVTRPLNLFRYLPQHGYDCHILTVKSVAYRQYEPELLAGLDLSKIHRAGSRDPQRIMYLLGVREVNPKTIARGARVGESLFPDSKNGWVAPAVRLGVRLHREHTYKAIISTSPPISSHLVGMRLRERLGIPWVADFRDFWTVYPIEPSYSSSENRVKAHQLLADIRQRTSAVVAINDAIGEYVGSTSVVRNGADSELARLWSPPPRDGRFVIGLLGSLSDSFPVEPLFRVLASLRETSPKLFEHTELIQVGTVDTAWFNSYLHRYQLTDRCEIHGRQPRRKTIELLSGTSMMYIGLSSEMVGVTSGRVFDMLVSGRPILAYANATTDLSGLISSTGCGHVFAEQGITEAAEYVGKLVQQHVQQALDICPRPPYAQPFLWENLAGQYAHVLDEVIA